MSKINRIVLLVCLMLLLVCAGRVRAGQEERDKRAPFEIELPEVALPRQKAEKVEIMHTPAFPTQASLRTIKLWALNPYAETFEYSKIRTFINRNSANIAVKTKRPVTDGIVIELDLSLLRDFRLLPDKNIIEITAVDAKGRDYSATFVLLSGGKTVAAGFTGRKLAVIIGISDYLNNDGRLGDLNYADDDAVAIRKFLRTPAGGDFAEDDIQLLTDKQADLATVRDRLKRFLSKAEPQDLIYLFLAGHGFPDPYNPEELYFAMHDSKLADLPNTALRMSELRAILKQQKAKRIIGFIDACHSAGLQQPAAKPPRAAKPESAPATGTRRGQVVAPKKASANQPPAVEVRVQPTQAPAYAEKNFREEGWAVLTSSDSTESSLEDSRWGEGHGLFTFAILEGLGGKADANADGSVTTGELFEFVQRFVTQESGGRQTPRALPGNDRLVLATVAKPASSSKIIHK